jgi:hypothetical protein
MFNTNICTRPSHPRSRVLAAGSANASDRTGTPHRDPALAHEARARAELTHPRHLLDRISGPQPEHAGSIPVGGTRSSRLPRRSSSPAAVFSLCSEHGLPRALALVFQGSGSPAFGNTGSRPRSRSRRVLVRPGCHGAPRHSQRAFSLLPSTGSSRAPRPRLPRVRISGFQPENTGSIPVEGTSLGSRFFVCLVTRLGRDPTVYGMRRVRFPYEAPRHRVRSVRANGADRSEPSCRSSYAS